MTLNDLEHSSRLQKLYLNFYHGYFYLHSML